MKLLPAIFALAILGTEVTACKHAGDKCSNKDYNDVKTQCECNTGKLLFCGHDVLKPHPVYEFLLNCKKPKGGGLQCLKGHCNKGKRSTGKPFKRGVTQDYVQEFRDRLAAGDPEALALEESGLWMDLEPMSPAEEDVESDE